MLAGAGGGARAVRRGCQSGRGGPHPPRLRGRNRGDPRTGDAEHHVTDEAVRQRVHAGPGAPTGDARVRSAAGRARARHARAATESAADSVGIVIL